MRTSGVQLGIEAVRRLAQLGCCEIGPGLTDEEFARIELEFCGSALAAERLSMPPSAVSPSLAVVGAYLLATELAVSGGDHALAFAEYERKMRGWVEATQKMGRDNAKRFTARNRFELWLQHRLMRIMPYLPGKALFMRRMLEVVNGIELPDPSTQPRPTRQRPITATAEQG